MLKLQGLAYGPLVGTNFGNPILGGLTRANRQLAEGTAMGKLKVRAQVIEGDSLFDHRIIEPVGREAQTLRALVEAGPKGITALDAGGWAVRLAHYIFKLRTAYGLDIVTIRERHGGEFPGKHGRYFLNSNVRLIDDPARAA